MHQTSLAEAKIFSKIRSVNDAALAAGEQAQLTPKSLPKTRRQPGVALAVAEKPVPHVPLSHTGSLGTSISACIILGSDAGPNKNSSCPHEDELTDDFKP